MHMKPIKTIKNMNFFIINLKKKINFPCGTHHASNIMSLPSKCPKFLALMKKIVWESIKLKIDYKIKQESFFDV